MSNGLEERFPFMDNDLVEFAMKIPAKHKLGNLKEVNKIDENNPRKVCYKNMMMVKMFFEKQWLILFLNLSIIGKSKVFLLQTKVGIEVKTPPTLKNYC